MNSEVFTLNEKLATAKNEIEMLTNEPSSGTDFIRYPKSTSTFGNAVVFRKLFEQNYTGM